MPLRRSLFTVLSLAALGMTSVVAQENNPFAEWDRIQSRTPVRNRVPSLPAQPVTDAKGMTSEKPAEKSTVAYFSPEVAEKRNDKPGQSALATPISMREKKQTPSAVVSRGADVRPAVASTSALPVAGGVPPVETPAPATRQRFTVDYDLTGSRASAQSGIHQASFAPDVETATGNTGKKIITVAAGPEQNGNTNPFEAFLGVAPATVQDAADTFESDFNDEDEAAEPLLRRPVSGGAPRTPVLPVTAARRVDAIPGSDDLSVSSGDDANSGPQSPGVTVQWIKHGGLNVGQECEIELVVRNTSQAVVRSVMVEAAIPANVEVADARPAAAEGSETPTWTFGELQPGQSRSVLLKLVPRTRDDVLLDAFVRLTGSTSSRFSVQEPMIGVAVSGPEKVEIGQQVGYIVRVSNPGTGLANNVVIQAAVPEGLEHRNGSLLNIEIGTLNPGESRQARLSLTAVQGGTQQLAVRVLADGGLSEQTTTSIEIAEPQLAITLAGPDEPHAGRSENYTLTVSNGGNVQSTNVRAKYIIPQGFTFVSADRGGKYVESDNAVEWFVGTLQPNDSSDFEILMKADEIGEVTHKAGVISEHGQVTTCELVSNVIGTAALDIKIASDHRECRIGDEIHWEVQVRNTGEREASNVGVSCELPAGFELIAAEGPTKYIAENGVLVFRSIPVIDAAADSKIVIRGRCLREGNLRLRMRVASESISEVLIGEGSTSVSR
ncbi:MAG: DUF11 domain-containing protein [Planctomycetaceae bacterium]|nr:DUF11 domain-containing protein [Planctomycetaceae bacterium]